MMGATGTSLLKMKEISVHFIEFHVGYCLGWFSSSVAME
jgi:hypothetical protein